ncbi:MAG: LemA family protein, partial [Demequinaceae bacterium]|nr:LemA family protein [Demequinaceae bacterium]
LKRRHDLIPNLVETVKGYAAHERGVFDEVTRARAAAASPGAGPAQQAEQENVLSQALGRMFDSPFLRYTAKISFGLYIWHHLVILWVGRVVSPEFLNYGGVSDPVRWLQISVFALVVSYIVAALSWHLIERPFLEGFLSGRRKAKVV